MAKPIRALQMRYPMIQFFIILLIHDTRYLCTRSRIDGVKAMSTGISGGKQVMRFANRPFARWRHFTTTSRILQGFALLLLFKPHWDYQI